MIPGRTVARSPGNIILDFRELYVQYRSGPVTAEFLDQVEASMAKGAMRHASCYLGIIDANAPMTDAALRKRQTTAIADSLRNSKPAVGLYIDGEGVTADLLRSGTRLLSLGKNVEFLSSLEEAISFAVAASEWGPADVRQAIEDAKSRAGRELD